LQDSCLLPEFNLFGDSGRLRPILADKLILFRIFRIIRIFGIFRIPPCSSRDD